MHPRDQTIFALSSGRIPSAVALVRVSGSQSGSVLERLAGKLPAPRLATRVLLRDIESQPIDDAVMLWFPGPASATGEDVAEFHVHGGRAVLASLFAAFSKFADVRPAEPGEFTRRAFENGKLDLTEAEALDDLIHADTDRQRRQALRQLKGLLGDRARDWRARIIEATALVEAGIDFSDEADVPTELIATARTKITCLLDEIREALASGGRGERLRDGLVVAITGPPNVGKSTLMNQLARREVAIVSPHAGATRDVIEVQLDLDGYPVTVIDTAGIRDTDDPVEQEGVRRARARAADADLVLWLTDREHDHEAAAMPPVSALWIVRNKVDLESGQGGFAACDFVEANSRPNSGSAALEADRSTHVGTQFSISAAQGQGVQALVAEVADFARTYFGGGEYALVGRQRHRELLRNTTEMLHRSISAADHGEELAAEELRIAAQYLGQLLGRVDAEDLLDVIFRKFCVGK